MTKDKQNKKASMQVFERAFDREFDLMTADMFESDKEHFAILITEDGIKDFYFKVAQRFCALVISEVFKGEKNVNG